MTLFAVYFIAVGILIGIMGTLTWLAIQRWQPPKRVELDERWQAVKKL